MCGVRWVQFYSIVCRYPAFPTTFVREIFFSHCVAKDREAWLVAVHGVVKSQTGLGAWTTTVLAPLSTIIWLHFPDAGKDWRKKKRASENEMAGWHQWWVHHTGHELGQTPGDGEGQGGLVCCSPCGRKESDTTGWQNNNNLNLFQVSPFYSISLYVCLYASTILFSMLQFRNMFWNQKVWGLQL